MKHSTKKLLEALGLIVLGVILWVLMLILAMEVC